ncbi:MAG: multifunctional oxoglutarate decarboxylase/oxoglutarate dehydrogenase thiamine pyrophosphate-binding subunit/dihydrolipoyllysine-residue succinyltransferase subunit [Chloroflexota bacterium]
MITHNEAFEDELYFQYIKDPNSVSPAWRKYFENYVPATAQEDLPPTPKTYGAQEEIAIAGVELPKRQEIRALKGYESAQPFTRAAGLIAENMRESLAIPTATSARAIPVKALEENRKIVNKYLLKRKRKKISVTHILAWAIVRTLKKYPNLNASFEEINGAPHRILKSSVNIGLAVDVTRHDGTRMLLVPNIKSAEKLDFSEFIRKYDELVVAARAGKITPDDMAETTVTLTNPGTIGTTFSAPRLMKGQGLIVAAGAMEYPPEFSAISSETLTSMAVSQVIMLTNTYDHRIIQGAESAEFLSSLNSLIMGKERFYDQIFYALQIPFEPVRWDVDAAELGSPAGAHTGSVVEKGAHVMQMINSYRVRGHLLAQTNPLGRLAYYYPELDPSYYGFTIWDLDRVFHAEDSWQPNNLNLRDILEKLRESYCGASGVEFMHIQNPAKKEWIKDYFECGRYRFPLTKDDKIHIYTKISHAEVFENFLHTKFVGHKRFSLEGAESLIVFIDTVMERAANAGLSHIMLGMAHRGRLNVLVNNFGKKLAKVFKEFEGEIDVDSFHGSGDVKYHLGDKGTFESRQGAKLEALLAPNPSHLELVDPVVEGMARALDREVGDPLCRQALPILVHGDAAFAGQGIVAETFNLSQLEGYKTGGTIHIVVNNQIGFTTTVDNSRSTIYATDIAKIIQIPIIHVNGNDPEEVVSAAVFAFLYRQEFGEDVVIDMLCYRKYGHNEADEPTYTQPLLYKKIKSMKPISAIYEQDLVGEGIEAKELAAIKKNAVEFLNEAFDKRKEAPPTAPRENFLSEHKAGQAIRPYYTAVDEKTLKKIADATTKLPESFNPNPKALSLLKKRAEMAQAGQPAIDWAFAEALALGSILLEGREIRMSGQDTRRGTFSQRHAVLTDYKTEDIYIPLNHIQENQAQLRIFDSPLSEIAVLGFEYGFSVVATKSLTLWEAQFGDFANNAVSIVDQFISCGESKWGQSSNLVMLLPHGYDGQGPEHSSARLERFLQLAAEDNMIIANFTSPANYFHALRRQMFMTFKIPMILMTPKSMLRHPLAVSSLHDLTNNEFDHIIDDNMVGDKEAIKRLVLCSGKIYYDLLERHNAKPAPVALVRVEQLYPLHGARLSEIFESYPNAEICWAQEEPKNMGAWIYMKNAIEEGGITDRKIRYIGRRASASTATGSHRRHVEEQNAIIDETFSF